MDKTQLVAEVKTLFEMTGCKVRTSVQINHREIDIVAEEQSGLVRKIVLIECADWAKPVGIEKLQNDLNKLNSGREHLGARAVVMHVASNGYTQDAEGYGLDRGLSLETPTTLELKLVNFSPYVDAILNDPIREVVLREYQPTRIHPDGKRREAEPALDFLQKWLSGNSSWLTVLGDYGVGKSWMLRRLLYELLNRYQAAPASNPLPFFVPLQRFTKAFDFQNLVLKTFEQYRLSGAIYAAFHYLAQRGRVVFLLDSFDEMAQSLGRDVLRENLKELLSVAQSGCRAIMTSRPTYFEGRAERLVVTERNGNIEWHPLDQMISVRQSAVSRQILDRLGQSNFARLNDLTTGQRQSLFRIVLQGKPHALNRLTELYTRFQELESLSQRAVIARLLTTVAETLSTQQNVSTIDGYELIPADLVSLNQAKIFEIVIYNLLHRDMSIGSLKAADRLRFLRSFAIFLQYKGGEVFAAPGDIRSLVQKLFAEDLKRSDTPQQLLENYYRACRRHSGLTTEGQFLDTSGNIDAPVDEADLDSKVGFSHNSLREYLVAEALADYILRGTEYRYLPDIAFSDLIGDFIVDMAEYLNTLPGQLRTAFSDTVEPRARQLLFLTILRFVNRDSSNLEALLGDAPQLHGLDLTRLDLSGVSLRTASLRDCEFFETDLRKSDLRNASFDGAILYRVLLDESAIEGADFTKSEVDSVYVMDDLEANTFRVLNGREARQWLFTKGAKVFPTDDLNPLLGRPWYEAAREVTRTIERRIAGTHQDVSLSKGTRAAHRQFAREFVVFLVKSKVLRRVTRSDKGPGYVVRVNESMRHVVSDFSQRGVIDPVLQPFFDKYSKANLEAATRMGFPAKAVSPKPG